MLPKEALQSSLSTSLLGNKLFFFESIDSTNSCLRTLAEAGIDEGAVVFTEYQTGGRGRHGRVWSARPNENLLFSVLLRPGLPRNSSGLLTFYAAVSVARAIEEVMGRSVECKWPNDLLLSGRKVCGILLENTFERDRIDYSIVGIGINVNQADFPVELAEKATSLALELRENVDRLELFSRVLESMEKGYDNARQGKFDNLLAQWNDRCRMFGREVTVIQDDQRMSGKAVGLDQDGGLVIQTPSGRRTVYAGDISLHPAGG